MLEGINWGIVFVAVVVSTTISLVLAESIRLWRQHKLVKTAMTDVDEEYERLLESA